MPLSEEEAKSIGRKTGEIVGDCKERASFILEVMQDLREHELDILRAVAFPKKAKDEMLFQINSEISTIEEYYPDSPLRSMVLDDLREFRGIAAATEKENPQLAIGEVAKGYENLVHNKLLGMMLDDFKRCACGG